MKSLLCAVAVLLACVGCSSPVAPPTPALLEARGELSFTCESDTCAFVGRGVNLGSGCAADVSGTVSLRVIGQTEPRFVTAWALSADATVGPGAEVVYSGVVSRKQFMLMLPTQWYTSTDFHWRDVRC